MLFACSPDPAAHVGDSNLTLHDFTASLNASARCRPPPSYIRPDAAGSILPWPYTVAWFLVHFPVTLIRVHRWERVQALSVILAVIALWFQLQAYASSVRPDAVLVWMPIFVVLDIGAMMQLVFLVVEGTGLTPLLRALSVTFRRNPPPPGTEAATLGERGGQTPTEEAGVKATAATDVEVVAATNEFQARRELVGRAWVAILACCLGLLLLGVQVFGLVMAVLGSRDDHVTADWCSTLFTSSLAVQSGCELYTVTPSWSQGIGCIRLRGYEQYTWLKASIVLISVSLIFQVFDCLILTLVNGTTRWRGAKMKRPWFTMFTGNAILLVLIIVGIIQSQRLPTNIDKNVIMYNREESLKTNFACQGELTPYGVRGAVIGWTDGFLESWDTAYKPGTDGGDAAFALGN